MADQPKPSRIGADQALAAAVRQIDTALAEQEQAANRILGLAELLLEHAEDAVTRARIEGVMEACGFQDVTGQRLQRVSRLLRHVGQYAQVSIPTPQPGSGAGVTTADHPTNKGLTQEQVDRLLKGRSV